jgi:glucose/arabinose dehydrogenase
LARALSCNDVDNGNVFARSMWWRQQPDKTVPGPPSPPTPPPPITSVTATAVATLNAPWSMVFLPDGNMLVTERPPTPATLLNPIEAGRLKLVTQAGVVSAPIAGLHDRYA